MKRLLAPKWANIVLAGTGIVVALTFLIIVFVGPNLSSTVGAVKDGNDADRCARQYAGVITDNRTHLDDARSDLVKAQFDGLVAATVTPDARGLTVAIADGNNAKTRITIWSRRTIEANDAYQRLLAAEKSDNDKFTAMCDEGP